MAWSSKVVLSLVELTIYVAILPVTVYTLYKHRRHSLFSHVYLYIFIGLRIVSDALSIMHRDDSPSQNTTGNIINSIGLSPLLLATAAFLNEARHYILDYDHSAPSKRAGQVFEFLIHIIVVTGVALLATGNSSTAKAITADQAHNDRVLAYAGACLLLASWFIVVAWACWVFRTSSAQKRRGSFRPLPRLLLTEIIISLPFTGVRVMYSMIYTFDRSSSLNPATATFAVDFLLIFLSQLVAVSILVVALVVTRNICQEGRETNGQRHELVDFASEVHERDRISSRK